MRHNWGVPSPGPTNMGLNLSLWASKWPLHLQMVKNANTNTANQMVSNQSMLEIHYQSSLLYFSFSQTMNSSPHCLNYWKKILSPSYPTWLVWPLNPKNLKFLESATNNIFCRLLNMEKHYLPNEDGPYFLYFDKICGKSGGNLVRAFTAPRTIESDTRK